MKIFRKRQKNNCKNEQLYCINQKKQYSSKQVFQPFITIFKLHLNNVNINI
jgi:hypothetical protein